MGISAAHLGVLIEEFENNGGIALHLATENPDAGFAGGFDVSAARFEKCPFVSGAVHSPFRRCVLTVK